MRSTQKDTGILQFEAANHWHALHTRYQNEKAVVQALSSKGHTVFLPLYGATHLWRGRPTQLQLPLFPGYVFIQGGIDRQLQILEHSRDHQHCEIGRAPRDRSAGANRRGSPHR